MNHTLRILILAIIATLCAAVPQAVAAAPGTAEPLPTDKPSVVAADLFASDVGTLENEYVGISVNAKGQFVIYTTGGDPEVVGDEGKLLMYPGATSFTTFRDRLDDAVNWKYSPSDEAAIVDQEIVDDCDDASRGNQCYIETFYHLGCQRWARQELSFMTNPLTGRKDMVRIAYDFEQRSSGCTDTFLNDTLIGSRIMLDTQIGDNDYAPFFLPGVGYTDQEATFSGDAVPPYFRVFEDPNFAPGSLQAIGYLNIGADTVNRPSPSRFQVASWQDIRTTDWDYETDEELPHGDSAIAVYWNSYREPWLTTFQIGYGLAPQGGGDTWTDAPAVLNDDNTFDSYSWVYNNTNSTYTGGRVTILVTAHVQVRADVGAAASEPTIQTLGDLAPGASAQVRWPLEIFGGPGTYTYTTIAEFTSGQIFTNVHEVTLQQGIKFSETNFTVTEGAGTVAVPVRRTNTGGDQITVKVNTVDNTAKAGEDFVPISTTLSIDGSAMQQTFSLEILDDSVFEDSETIVLELANPSPNATVVDQGQVVVTIIDNELNPALALTTNPAQLAHTIQNRSSPISQTLAITGAQVAWTAAASAPWIALSPAQGNGPGSIDVTFDVANLVAGTHSATVVLSNLATGQQTSIPIVLTVGAAQPWVSPTTLDVPVPTGNAGPGPLYVTIENNNVGRMEWSAIETIPWLSLSATSGTAPVAVEAVFDLTGLAPGLHSGAIEIHAGGERVVITVSVTVAEVLTSGTVYLPTIKR